MLYKVVCNSSQKNMQEKGKLQGLMLIQSNPRASKVGDTLGDMSVYDDTEHLPLSSCVPRTQQQPGVVANVVQLLCEIPADRNISRFIP